MTGTAWETWREAYALAEEAGDERALRVLDRAWEQAVAEVPDDSPHGRGCGWSCVRASRCGSLPSRDRGPGRRRRRVLPDRSMRRRALLVGAVVELRDRRQ
jgi:hypothetical protein